MIGSGSFLRKKVNFRIVSIIACIPIILTLLILLFSLEDERRFSFYCLVPLTMLFMYKCADYYILKKFNRHFYFYKKYSNGLESKNATWIEFLIQMSIAFIPLFFWTYLGELIFNLH
jgi:purine-cytosine permease-like protein